MNFHGFVHNLYYDGRKSLVSVVHYVVSVVHFIVPTVHYIVVDAHYKIYSVKVMLST